MRLALLLLVVAVPFAFQDSLPEALAGPACSDHLTGPRGPDAEPYSSPCIHPHREGVIVPLAPVATRVPLTSVKVEATAGFFSCMVRNFSVRVHADFALANAPSPDGTPLAVAFPISTHALYGDHNHLQDIAVAVNGVPIKYHVAMDYRLYSTLGGQLSYQGRVINYAVHPLLEKAADLRVVAPHLAARGFDLVLYWKMPAVSTGVQTIGVDYTSSSDDFSGCCDEVRDCTGSSDPYYFYFDLTNVNCWAGPTNCKVRFNDSQSAQWTSVPVTHMDTQYTPDAIELTSTNLPLEDLAVPVQPAVFEVWPRRWPQPPPPMQDFKLAWLGGSTFIDRVVVEEIQATPGLGVWAELPIKLSDENPVNGFTAGFMPPLPDPAFIDVKGTAYRGDARASLYDTWVRVPLVGRADTGHDLLVAHVEVHRPAPADPTTDWTVTAEVWNQGLFTGPVVATVLVDHVFVKTAAFDKLAPGMSQTIKIPVHWLWELPALVGVEIEPAAGEVMRMNNAASTSYPSIAVPRHARFVLQPGESNVQFKLLAGEYVQSKLVGSIGLFLGDPQAPQPNCVDCVGFSVDSADLVAPNFEPPETTSARLPEPFYMFQSPLVHSTGVWNMRTGQIDFELHLLAREGQIPAQQPTICSGTLANAGLSFMGLSSEPVAVPNMIMKVYAYEVPLPPVRDVWFSTRVGFHAGRLDADSADNIRHISPGDLLSRRGHVVRTNAELTRHLGLMPMAPDVGLDAVTLARPTEIWFSFNQATGPMWSETLAIWLKPGDLLSDAGRVVRTNQQLVQRFAPMPPVVDFGLDAVARGPNRDILFSVEEDFFSEALGRPIHHGDLLSSAGRILRTNSQLLAGFHPVGPALADYGLDAAVIRPHGEIWFSTTTGFHDAVLGAVSDGDVLSSRGFVVATNLDLLREFGPIEDLANFGLDAVAMPVSLLAADADQDGDVDAGDLAEFGQSVRGPAIASESAEIGDFDGDGDVDQVDFGIFQRCVSGTDHPANADCAE